MSHTPPQVLIARALHYLEEARLRLEAGEPDAAAFMQKAVDVLEEVRL